MAVLGSLAGVSRKRCRADRMHADNSVFPPSEDALLRGLFDAIQDVVAVLDPHGTVVRANAAARSAIASRSGEAAEPDWLGWWSAEDRDAALGALERARLGGVGRFEARRPGGDGGTRRWDSVVARLEGPAGEPAPLLAVSRDVTGSRALQGAYSLLRRRTEALIAATSEVVWRSNASRTNIALQGRKDRYRDWAAGVPTTWTDALHPDDRATVAARIERGLATCTQYGLRFRLRDRSGGWRWVEDRAVPVFDDDDRVIEWVGVVSDIHGRKAAQDDLQASEERLRVAVAASGVGVWDVDLETGARIWSPELKRILGLPTTAVASEAALLERVHPDDRDIAEHANRDLFPNATSPASVSLRIVRADDGETRWITSSGRALFDENGRAIRRVGIMQDVTQRRRTEAEAREREQHLHAALRVGRMVIWDRDPRTGVVTRSDNALDVLGSTREDVSEFFARVHPDDRDKVIWDPSVVPGPSSGSVQFRYRHPDGREMWLETLAVRTSDESAPGRVFGLTTDITAKKLADIELVRAATRDPLTGLLNRAAFAERLDQAIGAAAASGGRLHLLLIDVDSLKIINDSLGHDAGDAVLRSTAERLEGWSPSLGFVARLGGDEFAAVLAAEDPPEDGTAMSRQLIDRIARPMIYKGRSLAVGTSVGIATFPDHSAAARDLMKNADLALYSAKHTGRRRAHVFRPEMRTAFEASIATRSHMRAALTERRIVPFYQPKVDLATGAVVGLEALARWIHPERGLLNAAMFAPVFEDGALAIEVGAAMLERVTHDLRSWLDQGLPLGRVAVNCTVHELRSGDFAESVLRRLDEAGVPAGHFEIEVTEGVMMDRDAQTVAGTLRQLHEAGVKLSLDEFGTGYASLAHLKLFPVDEIKIDKGFVADVSVAGRSTIVEAIVAMGRILGLSIVADGVETAQQAEALLAIGCPLAQGSRFGKPMQGARVPWLLREGSTGAPHGRAPFRSAIRG